VSYAGGVFLAILAVAVVTGALAHAASYRRGRLIITPLQFVLRMVTALLLLGIIAMIFGGWVATARNNPLPALLLFTGAITLALAVLVIAMVDLRQVRLVRDLRQAELYLRAAKEAAQLPRKPKPSPPGDDSTHAG
jgi:hypothetical protein